MTLKIGHVHRKWYEQAMLNSVYDHTKFLKSHFESNQENMQYFCHRQLNGQTNTDAKMHHFPCKSTRKPTFDQLTLNNSLWTKQFTNTPTFIQGFEQGTSNYTVYEYTNFVIIHMDKA